MNVYLAGGMRSAWRDVVKSTVQATFFDPKEKELSGEWDLPKIGTWDFFKIKQSDVIFAYMEKTNPSGFGLATEIGYACGLGKTVILVLEENHEIHKDRYLEFLKKAANITFSNFENGVDFLRSLGQL